LIETCSQEKLKSRKIFERYTAGAYTNNSSKPCKAKKNQKVDKKEGMS
jgi:hypothetical protein